MLQQVKGTYERFPRQEPAWKPAYSMFSRQQSDEQQIDVSLVEIPTPHTHILEMIRLIPVYVVESTNTLVYHSRMMEEGKQYRITWCGEHFMLIRDGQSVHVYRFEADVDGAGD